MSLVKKFCPFCGNEVFVNENNDFSFCQECGNKIVLKAAKINAVDSMPSQPTDITNTLHKNDNIGHEASNTPEKTKLEKKLEEVEFYYGLTLEKKEYAKFDSNPTYYLKAQDILLQLSEDYPDDHRVWWELSKPVDYFCEPTGEPEYYNYSINDNYFEKALDYADIETKKKLIKMRDEYIEKKESANKKRLHELREQQEQQQKLLREQEEQRLKQLEEEKEQQRLAQEQQRLAQQQRLLKEQEELRAKQIEKENERQRIAQQQIIAHQQMIAQQQAKNDQEQKQQTAGAANDPQAPVSQSVKKNDYSQIDNSYFTMPMENNQTMIGIFKFVSNMLYLSAFRLDGNKSNTLYKEQSLTLKLDEYGRALKFDNTPIRIKGLVPPNNTIQIYKDPDSGNFAVTGMPLTVDANYCTQVIKTAKNPLFLNTKFFF